MRCILFCALLEICLLACASCIEGNEFWVLSFIVWNHIRCSVEDEDRQCCVCFWLVDDVEEKLSLHHLRHIEKRFRTVCRLNCIMWHWFIYLENIITKSIYKSVTLSKIKIDWNEMWTILTFTFTFLFRYTKIPQTKNEYKYKDT